MQRAIALAAVLAGLAWVAAPALSLRPVLPEAADFEQTLPRLHRDAGDGHGPEFVSPVITAPREFDLVGVGGELRPIELRVRDSGGSWSGWVETEAGDPAYTGGAQQVQLRSHGFRPRGELHYVEVSEGERGFGGGVLGQARGAIHDGFLALASSPVAEAIAPGAADAATKVRKPPRPVIVPRAAWGADDPLEGCPPRSGPALGEVRAAVVHHTVSTTDYPPEEAAAIVLGICRYHRFGNGWSDIGYNALVDRFGTVYEGRAGGINQPVVGAHTAGYNSQSTGVASIGDHTTVPLTPEAHSSLVAYLGWKLARSGVFPVRGRTTLLSAGGSTNLYPSGTPVTTAKVFGHGATNSTACPGATLAPQIATIRQQVHALIKSFQPRKKKRRKRRRR